jgi:hypothetical protein
MPHFGNIFNRLENGYLIDTVFYPNIASTRAFFAKHNKKQTSNSFLKRDAKSMEKDDIGVVIIPVKEIYNDGSLLYKLLKTNNWLLTYIDGGFMVLDWDPKLHIVKYYEPYYLQKLLFNESVSDHQKESLWYYVDKCYEDYRDIDSANLSLFIAYKLKDQYRIDSVEKRFSVLKKNKDTDYILTLNGKISIAKFIKKYPYDSRGWYLAYEQTHKKIFLGIAKLLGRRDTPKCAKISLYENY